MQLPMAKGYPILLEVADLLAVVVGGGGVAVRKVEGLLSAGATRIRCVSPRFHEQMPADIERIHEPYEARHLEGARLVFAATDDPITNAAVVRDANARGIFVNRVDSDRDAPGNFTAPAVHREQELTLAVWTGGNPAMAVAIRDDVAKNLDRGLVRMIDAMAKIRPIVHASGLPEIHRRAILHDLTDPLAIATLRDGGWAALRDWLEQRYPMLELPAT